MLPTPASKDVLWCWVTLVSPLLLFRAQGPAHPSPWMCLPKALLLMGNRLLKSFPPFFSGAIIPTRRVAAVLCTMLGSVHRNAMAQRAQKSLAWVPASCNCLLEGEPQRKARFPVLSVTFRRAAPRTVQTIFLQCATVVLLALELLRNASHSSMSMFGRADCRSHTEDFSSSGQ